MKTLALALSVVSGAMIASVAFFWIAAGEIYDYNDSFILNEDGLQTDVVLCLAGGKKRIPFAVDLWQKIRVLRDPKLEPVLFLSGVGPQAGFDTLREQGVPRETLGLLNKQNVIFENVSENTFENAQIFSSFVRQKNWKHVVLVTTGYHMRRAEFILRKAIDPGVEVDTLTVDDQRFDRIKWHKDSYAIRVTIIEYIKWLYYRYSYG